MQFQIELPSWIAGEISSVTTLPTAEERVALTNRLARLNFEHRTGGPFAALVVEKESGKLVAAGVNRVVPSSCSSAHAEIVTISLAQKKLGTFDLGGAGHPAHQLVVNWCPCAMCFGAVCWSGVRSLLIAGSGPELEEITGFDEGPIHPEWKRELQTRGIELTEGILRDQAMDVFRAFARSGQLVYNGRLGT